MPWHPRRLEYTNRISDELIDLLEIKNPGIVVVLAREERLGEVGGVHVGEWVRVGVPATETDVQTTNARAMVVYDYNLLMVRPKLDVI